MQERWKRWVWYFSLVIHVAHPNCQHPLSDFAAQKSSPYPIFLAASDKKVQPLFLYPFPCFSPFFSLCSYTEALPLSPKQNIPL